MVSKTSFFLTGRARHLLFPASVIFLLSFSLFFYGGEVRAITWQAQGPGPINQGGVEIPPDSPVVGAIESLVIDPNDNNIMYAGAVNGGIWKTTDRGVTWTPRTDNQISLSMGGMALDQGNTSHILAGFGAFSNARGYAGPAAGVIFSSDAGASWKSVGGAVTANINVSSVVVNGPLMFVASRQNILGTGLPTPVTGMFRSTDGGASFIKISGSGGLPLGSVTSLVPDPGNPNRLYAALQTSGIFRSDNLGKTWTNITPAGSGITDTTQNIKLSVGAGGQSLFMGVVMGILDKQVIIGGELQSVWRYLDRGATWQNMGGQGPGPSQGLPGTIENGAFIGINNDIGGDNNFVLRADPQNPDIVYVSGDINASWDDVNCDPQRGPWPNQIGATNVNYTGSIFRGDASQPLSNPPAVGNWTPTTPYTGQWLPITDNFANGTTTHADSRSMTFDNLGNLLQTDDGGVYRRSTPQSSNGVWTSLIGNLQVTEIRSISFDNITGTLICGNQDAGSTAQNGIANTTWTAKLNADGGMTAINDQNRNFSVRYMSTENLGEFTRFKVDPDNSIKQKQATNLLVATPGGPVPLHMYDKDNNSQIPFTAPVRLNQADKSHLVIGTQIIYLARDDVSGTLSPNLYLAPFTTALPNQVNDIAYGRMGDPAHNQPGNPNLLLVGAANDLYLSTSLLPGSLNKLSNYNTNSYITSVFINPYSDSKFYVADVSCVRSTLRQGQHWTTGLSLYQLNSLQFITSGLNAVVAGGYGALYAARDTDLDNWYSLKGNLPNTYVFSMDYSSTYDTLAVGTLGRGAFTLTHASTLMPLRPTSVDTGWIRLLRFSSGDQILNGGTVQNPDSWPLGINLTLTSLGGTFDTNGPNSANASGTDSTLAGVVSGPGSLTITGNGTLTLQNTNTYAGGTNFNGGTVIVTSDANLGTGKLSFDWGTLQTAAPFTSAKDITLLAHGGTWDTLTFNSALSGNISGPGTLTKMGHGTLTLTGLNTYSGGTLLNGGILKVSQDANLGAATGPLSFKGGTLLAAGALTTSRAMVVLGSGGIDTGAFASVFNGELFGYGTLTQQGAGSLTLNGDGSPFAGTYNLISGALTLNNALGSTLQPCSLVVNPGSTFSGNGTLVGSLTLQGGGSGFAGSILVPSSSTLSGNGPLHGSLNLQGNGSGYGGTYTVMTNGSFNLGNTLGGNPAPSTVVVSSNSLMTGNGTLVGILTSKGAINPGNSPGTLNVVGRFTQTGTGTYTVEIASPSIYDTLAVTGAPGTASLAGTISPVLLGGYQPLRNTVFPGVVTAAGGITGAFDSVANPVINPTLSWQTRSTATSVDLAAVPDFANAGLPLTKNHQNVGVMLNDLNSTMGGDLGQVLHVISQLPAGAAVADAYQQISPDKASALPSLSLAGSMMQWQSVANRLSYQRWRQGGMTNLAEGRSGSFNLSYNSLAGLMLAYNGSDLAGLVSGTKPPAERPGPWGVFTDFISSFGNQDSTTNMTGYNFSIFGFTAGADYRLQEDLVIGLGTGYYNTSASYKGSGGSAGISSIPFYAYGAYTPGSFYAMGYLGYTLNLYSLNRNLAFGGLNRVATGLPSGNQLNASLETGYDLKLAKFTFTPAFTLYYSTAWVDSFTESGAGALNLNVASQNADSLQTGLGLRLSRPFQSGRTLILPQLYAFWQHEFANNSRGLDARLAQAGNTFAFQTDSPSRNFAVLGAGMAVGLSQNLTLRATYNAEVGRGGYTPQVVSAGLRYEF